METKVLTLSMKNLSYCCGPGRTIAGIEILAELVLQRRKQISNKRKFEDTKKRKSLDWDEGKRRGRR